MIAVSSFKPLDLSPSIAENQIEANRYWQSVFKYIIYLNEYEDRLASPITFFVPSEPFPKIKDMVDICSDYDGWSCIINSDIIVTESFASVEYALDLRNALCATSRRINFNPHKGFASGRMDDMGLDIFIARKGTWGDIASVIPEEFRIGHGLWDTWMAGFFNKYGSYYDITPFKCIYHPNHEDRVRPHQIPDSLKNNEYVKHAAFPRLQLSH